MALMCREKITGTEDMAMVMGMATDTVMATGITMTLIKKKRKTNSFLFLNHKMEFIHTPISGLLVIRPKVFGDERGSFFESYNKNIFSANGMEVNFVQDNISVSKKNVL